MTENKKVASPESDAEDGNNMHKEIIAPKKRRVNARIVRRIAEFVFHLILSALSAIAVASWAVPAAYAERGYSAFGGEWLLVILTFCVVLYFCEVIDVSD